MISVTAMRGYALLCLALVCLVTRKTVGSKGDMPFNPFPFPGGSDPGAVANANRLFGGNYVRFMLLRFQISLSASSEKNLISQ